jgi:hypothetical protein
MITQLKVRIPSSLFSFIKLIKIKYKVAMILYKFQTKKPFT